MITVTELEQTVGPGYLRGMHLNDSKTLLGSHKDRHDNIGQCVPPSLPHSSLR